MRVKYEDLSLKPQETTAEIFKFLGLPFHFNVKSFIENHTNLSNIHPTMRKKLLGTYSTYRDSSKTPYAWKKELDPKEISKIEKYCEQPLKLLGYQKYID